MLSYENRPYPFQSRLPYTHPVVVVDDVTLVEYSVYIVKFQIHNETVCCDVHYFVLFWHSTRHFVSITILTWDLSLAGQEGEGSTPL